MNYYIQGGPQKAEQIKAAFKEKGYRDQGWAFSSKHDLYFSVGALVYAIPYKIRHIITERPDYKELELPIEHKFKVGDWVATDYGKVSQVVSVDNDGDGYTLDDGVYFSCSWCDMYHHWTIQDAKDGDVLAFNDSPDVNLPLRWIGIYKQPRVVSNKYYWFHCIIAPDYTFRGYDSWWVSNVHPATKEQRNLLFSKMKKAGYQWDADKKELRKIQPHYDIANFKPFDKVLVRYYSTDNWKCGLFSHLSIQNGAKFVCVGATYYQCIPFNDDTKHLLGTTDMCDEQYINW